jgi:glycine oxidase
MPQTFDVLIIGGGAIGSACARELAATGRKILVVEAGTPMGQAWRAAAGMLAPQIEATGTDPLLEFGVLARDHYNELGAALQETTGVDLGLWREGIARVASDPADAEALHAKVLSQREHHYRCEWLTSQELRVRWPWLGPAVGALWAPEDGALEPERLVQALSSDAERLGAATVTDRVVEVTVKDDRITGVVGERDRYSAPQVVLAAGAWSRLIQGLPRRVPVEPIRGQMAALAWPNGMRRAIIYHRDSYLLTRGSEAIVGSTMEHAGFNSEVTPAGVAQIFASTITLCPALVRAKVRRTWAGLRPVTPDGLPIIGEEPELSGLWYATGHGRNGILLAGITGRVIAQLLNGERPDYDMIPFSPKRFRAR